VIYAVVIGVFIVVNEGVSFYYKINNDIAFYRKHYDFSKKQEDCYQRYDDIGYKPLFELHHEVINKLFACLQKQKKHDRTKAKTKDLLRDHKGSDQAKTFGS
jgi:hypothetical protein